MKGKQISQFHKGQPVKYLTDIGTDTFKTEKDERGNEIKVFERHNRVEVHGYGQIVKLHKSGSHGVAEIRREGGGKISRRLQMVERA